MRSEPVGRGADEGFTLLEVLVSLAVISAAMAGLGAFFVNGSLAVAQQRDHRQAAQIASNSLEQLRALEGSSLLTGRGFDQADKQRQDALAGPFKAKLEPYFKYTKLEWDTSDSAVGKGEDAPIPTATQIISAGGTTFQEDIFVGGCEVYVLRKDDCVFPLAATDPKRPTNLATILQYFRVVVLVSWPHKSCADTAGQCAYVTSTLISRNQDDNEFSNKLGTPDIAAPVLETFYVGLNSVSVTMKAYGGNLPYSWTATGLPPGLTIDRATGKVSGRPTQAGVFPNSTVTATETRREDGKQLTDTMSNLTWTVVDPPTLRLPGVTSSYVGEQVSIVLPRSGGVGQFTYKFEPALPTGFTYQEKADKTALVLTGTVTKEFATNIKFMDENEIPGELLYTHTIYKPLAVQPIADQNLAALATVNLPTAATGGDGTYQYAATGLPVELQINQTTGVISGGPVLIPGRYLPTVTVTDGHGKTATAMFVLVVAPSATGLNITSPATDVKSVRGEQVTVPVTTNANAVGANGTRISVVGLLPPGLSWNNGKDTISGTPTTAGTYLVTLSATSASPLQTVLYTFVWTVS